MNDATVNDFKKGQEVFFFLKPHDKQPHMITTVIDCWEDDRGKEWAEIDGVTEYIPLYHIRPILGDIALVKMYGRGIE